MKKFVYFSDLHLLGALTKRVRLNVGSHSLGALLLFSYWEEEAGIFRTLLIKDSIFKVEKHSPYPTH